LVFDKNCGNLRMDGSMGRQMDRRMKNKIGCIACIVAINELLNTKRGGTEGVCFGVVLEYKR
jgi:hypothetical protein